MVFILQCISSKFYRKKRSKIPAYGQISTKMHGILFAAGAPLTLSGTHWAVWAGCIPNSFWLHNLLIFPNISFVQQATRGSPGDLRQGRMFGKNLGLSHKFSDISVHRYLLWIQCNNSSLRSFAAVSWLRYGFQNLEAFITTSSLPRTK